MVLLILMDDIYISALVWLADIIPACNREGFADTKICLSMASTFTNPVLLRNPAPPKVLTVILASASLSSSSRI